MIYLCFFMVSLCKMLYNNDVIVQTTSYFKPHLWVKFPQNIKKIPKKREKTREKAQRRDLL